MINPTPIHTPRYIVSLGELCGQGPFTNIDTVFKASC